MTPEFVLRGITAPILVLLLRPPECVVGRSSSCDHVIAHWSVSRKHAVLQVNETFITVKDLDSRNGTFVDHRKIRTCHQLLPGQVIQFGGVCFVVGTRQGKTVEEDEEETGSGGGGDPEAQHDFGRGALSEAQRRVFEHLLRGDLEKSIAKRLALSRHTVHNHVRAIYRLFGVHSRPALLAKFVEQKAGGPAPSEPDD